MPPREGQPSTTCKHLVWSDNVLMPACYPPCYIITSVCPNLVCLPMETPVECTLEEGTFFLYGGGVQPAQAFSSQEWRLVNFAIATTPPLLP